jgi:enoyl-CoA hydratase/carnithine racemase
MLKGGFVKLGLCPEYGSSLILPRLVGQVKANELLLLSESFNGEQAAAWGIANQALADGAAAFSKARETALRLLELAPSAVQVSKRLMRAPGREALRQVIREEGELFGARLRHPEAVEALSAFMQKRKADFSRF